MKALRIAAVVVGVACIGASALTSAAEDIGKREYDSNCAVCHGVKGLGNGPLAGLISTTVPDLTTLQKRNKGVFPFYRVYEMIDGRAMVPAHGDRDMPVWGDEYNDRAIAYYSDFFRPYDAKGFVRARILALTNYLYTLQVKEE